MIIRRFNLNRNKFSIKNIFKSYSESKIIKKPNNRLNICTNGIVTFGCTSYVIIENMKLNIEPLENPITHYAHIGLISILYSLAGSFVARSYRPASTFAVPLFVLLSAGVNYYKFYNK